jgi:hypothetical protein
LSASSRRGAGCCWSSSGTSGPGRLAADRLDPDAYDPFHLIVADIAAAQILSWDGIRATRTSLSPGTHLITSAGLEPQGTPIAAKFAAARPGPDPADAPVRVGRDRRGRHHRLSGPHGRK